MRSSAGTVDIHRLALLAVVVVAFLAAFIGFFDRFPIFHDEIINTYKANIGLIFDYALRPMFYALNYLAYHLFGHAPRSLSFSAALCFIFTTVLLFKTASSSTGTVAGVATASIFLATPLATSIGLAAMPHLYAGCLAVLTVQLIFLASTRSSSWSSAGLMLVAGPAAVAMVATHPTMLGVLLPLVILLTAALILRRTTLFSVDQNITPSSYFAFIFASGLAFAALETLTAAVYGKGYIEAYLAAEEKINLEAFSRYFKPWYWYVAWLLNNQLLLLGLVLLCVIYLASGLRREGTTRIAGSVNFAWPVLGFSWCLTFMFLAALSAAPWKFERVLVSWIPLASLACGLLFGAAYSATGNLKRARLHRIVLLAGLGTYVFWGAGHFFEGLAFERSHSAQLRAKYQGLYEVLANLQTDRIGYVGQERGLRGFTRYATISGKELVPLLSSVGDLQSTSAQESLFERMTMNGISFLLIETGRTRSRRVATESTGYRAAADWLSSHGAQLVYRFHYHDLWAWIPKPQKVTDSTALGGGMFESKQGRSRDWLETRSTNRLTARSG
jgi:hypothetical protein